jgi:hypothetical protein
MKENLNSANEILKKISPKRLENGKRSKFKNNRNNKFWKSFCRKKAESDIDLAKDLDETANETQKTSWKW